MKRRAFITTAAAGAVAGFPGGQPGAASKNKTVKLKRERLDIGIVGLGPYSNARLFANAINKYQSVANSCFKVTAVWGKPGGYRTSFRGEADWAAEQAGKLPTPQAFADTYDIPRVVDDPADMVKRVKGVFITDPDHSLELARPFLEKGMPVFVDVPIAWSLREARELIALAKKNNAVLATGSFVPASREFQSLKNRIGDAPVASYYLEGAGSTFINAYAHMFATGVALAPGTIDTCTTFGWNGPADADPAPTAPLYTHLKYKRAADDREPTLGLATNVPEPSVLNWAQIHCDSKVFKDQVNLSGSLEDLHQDVSLCIPLLRVVEYAFMNGVWPRGEECLLNYIAALLMAHKSGVINGRMVSRSDVEDHELPRHITA